MRSVFLLAVLGLTAACTPNYPLDKPGTWSLETRPSANDLNLRATLVDSHDLAEGAGESVSLSREAGPPVARLLSGHRTPLPASSSMQVQYPNEVSAPQQQGANQ